MAYAQPRSPELKHPVPTHPAYIPEPPATPNSPQGYQRFVSSPPDAHAEPAHPAFPTAQPYGGGYAHPQQQQQHPAFQQAQARMAAAVPPPDYGAWGVDAATTQLGMQIGQGAFDAGRQYVDKNVRVRRRSRPPIRAQSCFSSGRSCPAPPHSSTTST
jgi:hypothetical protein